MAHLCPASAHYSWSPACVPYSTYSHPRLTWLRWLRMTNSLPYWWVLQCSALVSLVFEALQNYLNPYHSSVHLLILQQRNNAARIVLSSYVDHKVLKILCLHWHSSVSMNWRLVLTNRIHVVVVLSSAWGALSARSCLCWILKPDLGRSVPIVNVIENGMLRKMRW